jgi:hypothetical protein
MIKKNDDNHVDDCTFATDHNRKRKQREANIFTASRSTADIPKISIFCIFAKIRFNPYRLMTASVQIMHFIKYFAVLLHSVKYIREIKYHSRNSETKRNL